MEKNKNWTEEAEKVFISGKITGEPIEECLNKFDEAGSEAWLSVAGFEEEDQIIEVVNPLWLEGIHFGISHKEAMEICLEALKDCSHIYMLKDWKESEGAKIEH